MKSDRVYEAFCTIIEILSDDKGRVMCKKELDILGQALQRLEVIDNANPSEALNITKATEKYTGIDLTIITQALLKAQEQEKILSIIKEKNVWVARLKGLFKKYNNDLDVLRIYNANMHGIDYQLTQEEFDLLKRYFEKNIQK